jgi:integrase
MLASSTLPTMTILPVSSGSTQHDPLLWLDYFDPQLAIDQARDHIESLPGSRHERHTMRAYLSSLADFCSFHLAVVTRRGDEDYDFDFSTMHMPTSMSMTSYIAHCKKRGLASSTITRYLASVRLFLKGLTHQRVMPRTGSDFFFITDAQHQFKLAGSERNPAPDKTSNRPALEQHGTRLTLSQVNQLLDSFIPEIHTLTGKRDLALLYLGITSGLRAAEIARITLNNITQGADCYEIRVRGKRNNYDPVGIDSTAYTLITSFVNAWNTRAAPDMQITGDVPIFQPVQRGDHLPVSGVRGYRPASGLTPRAVLKIVERRTEAALKIKVTAHDLRRTCAFLMRSNGYEWDEIRSQLRHRSIGTTERYVGKALNLSKALLSNSVDFHVPSV